MMVGIRCIGRLLLLALAVSVPRSAEAQSYGQTARAFVQAPVALGMGDAAVAVPRAATAFFYNPAHLTAVASPGLGLSYVGTRGALSTNVFEQVAFYADRLDPALEQNLDLPSDELEALYDDALRLGRTRSYVHGDALLPSVVTEVGGLGVGLAFFSHTGVQYRFFDAGDGVPVVDLIGRADVIMAGAVALDAARVGLRGLSVGLAPKVTRRYATVKQQRIDALQADENLYLLRAHSVGLDIGVRYRPGFVPLPGRLEVGLAVYDLLARPFRYRYVRVLNNADATREPAVIAREEAYAGDVLALSTTFRLGAAYTMPLTGGVLETTTLALDYVHFVDPLIEQTPITRLRLGAETQVTRRLAFRLGLSQGYTTVGAGLRLGLLRIDYAFYGFEEGRLPGQVPNWNHTLQIALSALP